MHLGFDLEKQANILTYIQEPSSPVAQRRFALIFICVPVSPGNSRLIWTFPRNFGVWIDRIVPRWLFHVGQNLILDSDLYLLHLEVASNFYLFPYYSRIYLPPMQLVHLILFFCS